MDAAFQMLNKCASWLSQTGYYMIGSEIDNFYTIFNLRKIIYVLQNFLYILSYMAYILTTFWHHKTIDLEICVVGVGVGVGLVLKLNWKYVKWKYSIISALKYMESNYKSSTHFLSYCQKSALIITLFSSLDFWYLYAMFLAKYM